MDGDRHSASIREWTKLALPAVSMAALFADEIGAWGFQFDHGAGLVQT